jgi:hypothetical protein
MARACMVLSPFPYVCVAVLASLLIGDVRAQTPAGKISYETSYFTTGVENENVRRKIWDLFHPVCSEIAEDLVSIQFNYSTNRRWQVVCSIESIAKIEAFDDKTFLIVKLTDVDELTNLRALPLFEDISSVSGGALEWQNASAILEFRAGPKRKMSFIFYTSIATNGLDFSGFLELETPETGPQSIRLNCHDAMACEFPLAVDMVNGQELPGMAFYRYFGIRPDKPKSQLDELGAEQR